MRKYVINIIQEKNTKYRLKKILICFKINKTFFLTINAIKIYYTKQLQTVF